MSGIARRIFSGRYGLWALVASAVIVWSGLIDWTGPLNEMHDFRQSQTAISAYWMVTSGINLLRPPLGLFGREHMSVPLEFPAFQASIALLARVFGQDSTAAVIIVGRILSFSMFLLTGVAFYRLLVRMRIRNVAAVSAGLFFFLPYPVFWSSTVMIEYMALAATLFYVEAVWRVAVEKDYDWRVIGCGAACGALGFLVKVTTALVYCPFLVGLWLYWITRRERPGTLTIAAATLCLGVLPLSVGYAWVAWSDAIKWQSPLTFFLTSAGSAGWNFGTLQERLVPFYWAKIFGYWILQIYAVIGLPFALIGIWPLWRQARGAFLFSTSVAATAILVFFNLYQVHNYYHIAILPALLLPFATGVDWLLTRLRSRFSLAEPAALCGIVLLCWGMLYAQTILPSVDYPRHMLSAFRFGPAFESATRKRDLAMADLIRRYSRPDEVVAIAKDDWSATVAFFAERRAVMLQNCRADLEGRDAPHADLYIVDHQRSPCRDMNIPAACSLGGADGISMGRCLAP